MSLLRKQEPRERLGRRPRGHWIPAAAGMTHDSLGNHLANYEFFSDAISITKRYFTSPLSMRSYASLI